jgi:hypothetical protein
MNNKKIVLLLFYILALYNLSAKEIKRVCIEGTYSGTVMLEQSIKMTKKMKNNLSPEKIEKIEELDGESLNASIFLFIKKDKSVNTQTWNIKIVNKSNNISLQTKLELKKGILKLDSVQKNEGDMLLNSILIFMFNNLLSNNLYINIDSESYTLMKLSSFNIIEPGDITNAVVKAKQDSVIIRGQSNNNTKPSSNFKTNRFTAILDQKKETVNLVKYTAEGINKSIFSELKINFNLTKQEIKEYHSNE